MKLWSFRQLFVMAFTWFKFAKVLHPPELTIYCQLHFNKIPLYVKKETGESNMYYSICLAL